MAREKSKDHELSACLESKIVDCAAKVHSACSGTEWISYGHLVLSRNEWVGSETADAMSKGGALTYATGLAGAASTVASAGAGGTVAVVQISMNRVGRY